MTARGATARHLVPADDSWRGVPSVVDIAATYAYGSASPVEILDFFLARISAADGELNSFVLLDAEGSRRQARQSADRWRQGRPLSPLDGVPITVKDMLEVAGLPMRCGSLVSDPAPRLRSAPAVERLQNAGLVIVGLTTTAEYGGAPVTISPLTGITRNAWNPEYSAGGSSGGAAVSVAAGFAASAIATDTGGSIRIPSSFNGVVGLKPTGGRIPTDPASILRTMGCPGPIARRVADCAAVFAVLADGRHGASDTVVPDYQQGTQRALGDMRVIASRTLGYASFLDEEVVAAFDCTLAMMRQNGVQVREVEPALSDPTNLFQAYTRANYASWFVDLAADDIAKLSVNVRAARAAGLEMSAVDLLKAARGRQELVEKLTAELGPFDVLLTPMVAVPPFDAEAFAPNHPAVKDNPRSWSPFGSLFNLVEWPALTLPCGLSTLGLPIGLQIVAPKWQESLLLRAAEQVEALLDFDASAPLKRVTAMQAAHGAG